MSYNEKLRAMLDAASVAEGFGTHKRYGLHKEFLQMGCCNDKEPEMKSVMDMSSNKWRGVELKPGQPAKLAAEDGGAHQAWVEHQYGVPGFTVKELSTELWREYQWGNGTVYRIDLPYLLYRSKTSHFHLVVDGYNVVHLVPAPGHFGCVVRWKNHEWADKPIAF